MNFNQKHKYEYILAQFFKLILEKNNNNDGVLFANPKRTLWRILASNGNS